VRSTSIAADPTRVLRYSVTDGGGLSGHDERAASVAPRPPVADTAPALAGVLRTGGTVTGARGDWSGTEPIAYAYQWERCDGASCVPIAGATGLTHVVSADDAGHALRLQVVADNAAPGTVTAHSPRSAVVAPALAAPTIAGGPDVTTTSTDAAFALVAEPGAELQCSLDGGPWEPCGARHTRSDLPVGAHELRVRQTLDGLTSPEAGYRWTVARPAVAPAAVGKVPNSDGSVRADAGTVAAVCGTSGAAMRSCAVVATVTVVVDGTRRTIVVGRGRTGAGKAGAERPVRIRLTPAGRRLLSRTGHLDATFAFTAVDAKGGVRGVSRRARITARLSLTVRRYFPVNDPHLTASTKAFLRHLAKRYPYATHLRCEGHADGTATDAHGLWLGLHRARNACGFLAGHGLRASRRIVTYGTRRPFASDRTGAGRARNRVVVITLSS
jgi:outer membrane protein OmpA-like peptidoglycan-associated protein